ncbi:hypothetical protein [Geothrix sp. 21YS21S-2]|uniref:hypothetical protein n=1 Tax=Geothrix sp. 21YS21S-2 TaxID=3068893 RepID=UPI0027BA1839|nr:hypothetical protein [Geothrix sp. 21YS21S-2]
MKPYLKGADPGSMLQDLKTNRRVQAALAALFVMVWLLWPSAQAPKPAGPGRRPAAPLGDRQARELQKLPDLSALAQAGELPPDARMARDLFLFEAPPPPPPPPRPEKPPPPPTPEELAARQLAADRAREAAGKPQLRFLGYLGTAGSGRLGAFMKGEEPLVLAQGSLLDPRWRLVKVTDATAEFQNVRFADLRHRIDAIEARGPAARVPSNEF